MAFKKKTLDSNLFSIDFDAIERILLDANKPLIEKVEELINNANDYTDGIDNIDTAEKFKSFLKKLRSLKRELSKSRLGDGRPFTEATKVVKNWFSSYEDKLTSIDNKLSNVLADYANKIQEEARKIIQKNEVAEKIKIENTNKVGESYSGDTIITTNTDQIKTSEAVPEIPDVNLEWEVESFDRDKLSLDIIKSYLSDYAIITALKNHLKEKGPNILEGVKYKKTLAKRL